MPGFWLGLAMMQDLFTREHNAICDHLHGAYPSWSDEELFQRARLINSALLAKIHTVEWTPAVISHPTTVKALRAKLVGHRGGARPQPARAHQRQRGHQRHPRRRDRPLRRPVRAHRGVRGGVPHAPADPRRLASARRRRRHVPAPLHPA
ncbi:peroxidase family protein [Streptomyces echinatus]|uniref:peroxidase family protein n=1 Tax=Streptomyces echinatus TaxID=67293 RepID=UPI0031EE6EBD